MFWVFGFYRWGVGLLDQIVSMEGVLYNLGYEPLLTDGYERVFFFLLVGIMLSV